MTQSEMMTLPCPICGGDLSWEHDHRADNTGLDDGPLISLPRKKPEPKSPEALREIRTRAWKTRRAKHGNRGHR